MLADWSETWQLKFNASKCKVLHISSILLIVIEFIIWTQTTLNIISFKNRCSGKYPTLTNQTMFVYKVLVINVVHTC